MPHFLLLACLALLIGWSPSNAQVPCPAEATEAAPDSFHVTLETTQGDLTIAAARDWSPHGVDRFYCLVEHDHFDDLRVFRVVEDFVAQFGLTGDPAVDSLWAEAGIPDERVAQSNTRGRIAFARSGPETRSAQLFINLSDNTDLDTVDFDGVTGFPPIGEVIDGMDAADAFYDGYGEDVPQDSIQVHGDAYLDEHFPNLDRIHSAEVTGTW